MTVRNSRELQVEELSLLQVPGAAEPEIFQYHEDDSDSDFSDDLDTGSLDDLEEEEKALIKSYLHNPPALHVRR